MARTLKFPQERLRPPTDTADSNLRELLAVREIVQAFLAADRPDDVFQFALDRVSPLVGATLSCVYLVDGVSELMRLAAAHNWPDRYARFLGDMRVRLGQGPSGVAARERRPVEVSDVFGDSSHEEWKQVAHELGFRSLVALPLQVKETVLGTATFYFAGAGPVAPETLGLLRAVADQMAATADRARMVDDLRRTNAALKETNVELERQYVDLLDARRVKDEFLANISHELRTPLTAVIGYVSLLEEGLAGPVTEDQRQTLNDVKASSDRLLALIGDLLDFTALTRGTTQTTIATFDPRTPVRDAVAAIDAQGRPNGVALDVVLPDQPPAMVSDQRKVQRILEALLHNAFKFTHDGAVRVSLQPTADRVVYVIEDTGIGIASDAQAYVFEDFRQADGGMTRRYGGSGLGLALARRLARALGGDVTLASAPAAGSTFWVDLPLRYECSPPLRVSS